MNKRQFLSFATFGLGTFVAARVSRAATSPAKPDKSVTLDDVTFSWCHNRTSLIGTVSAPTKGWIAIGFNEESGLKDTRFIMAATSLSPIRADERIARVPNHKTVAELGLKPALELARGSYTDGRSHLEFHMSHKIAGRPALSLAPGSRVHVMLAWSQAVTFDHHSAWRKHFPLTL